MEVAAPFNMALDTLMRLSEILKEYKRVSFGVYQGVPLPPGEAQHLRFKIVTQFRVAATPLLKKDQKEQIDEDRNKLKPDWVSVPNKGGGRKYLPNFNPKLDIQLDNLLMKMQECLQSEGYFMPPKKDLGKSIVMS